MANLDRDPKLQPVPGRSEIMAKNEKAWEDWGKVDPLWAVVTRSGKEYGHWDIAEFFRTGREGIDSLMAEGAAYGVPTRVGNALDFGCGVGRLTRALGAHVDSVLGLDVSNAMIDRAVELNVEQPRIAFSVHRDSDLHGIGDDSLAVVCSLLVLQHIPSVPLIENYLREFVRVLSPGGFMFVNLPTRVVEERKSLRGTLRPRTRVLSLLRRLGVGPVFLYRRFNWSPDMPMTAIPSERVISVIVASGGRILESRVVDEGDGVCQGLYLVTC